jgi:integrase
MQKVNETPDATKLRWLKDGLRHTFASAHMAKFGDATKLMLAMGHKDLKMIWKNYYRHMTTEEADKFWGIVPRS